MSTPNFWDHLFVLAAVVAYPIYDCWKLPSFIDKVRERGEPARIGGYRETIGTWLAFGSALVALWVRQGRDWAELGVRWGEPLRFGLGLAFGLLVLWIIRLQMQKLAQASSAEVVEQLGKLDTFVPRSRRELAWFRAVSVNAGVTEELIFRGFLLWYLEPFVGLFWAAVLAVVAFTFAHAYQGLAHLPGIAFLSLCFVVLYLLTGSLLLPVVLHALVDIVQGNALARILGSIGRGGRGGVDPANESFPTSATVIGSSEGEPC